MLPGSITQDRAAETLAAETLWPALYSSLSLAGIRQDKESSPRALQGTRYPAQTL